MAARATWKGVLKVSLVSLPIKVFPATETEDSLAFHQLHGACTTRINQRKWCPTCAKEVEHSELVKGFEFAPGKYVVLSEEEIATVKPESTKTIDLVRFEAMRALDPIYVARSYYLAPHDHQSAPSFAVMRDGMRGKVGVGKLAIYGREYLVAVRPYANGLVLHTLHHEAELRAMDGIDELGAVPAKGNAKELTQARRLIASYEGALKLGDFTDDYRAGLQRVIDRKIKGEQIVEAPVVETPAALNLRDALQRSLHLVRRRQPAKVRAIDRRRKRA